MGQFKLFLTEKKDPTSTTFHAFDLDDTLVHHNSQHLQIHVVNPQGQRVLSLTTKQLIGHKLPAGHKYDYTEFASSNRFRQSATPIKGMVQKLKAIHKNNKNVEIITGRKDFDDQPQFAKQMRNHGVDIDQIHVRRAGNLPMSTPDAKAHIISRLINKEGYKKVHLYDDASENLTRFLQLKKDHPDVELHAHHVQHDPETDTVKITTRKV